MRRLTPLLKPRPHHGPGLRQRPLPGHENDPERRDTDRAGPAAAPGPHSGLYHLVWHFPGRLQNVGHQIPRRHGLRPQGRRCGRSPGGLLRGRTVSILWLWRMDAGWKRRGRVSNLREQFHIIKQLHRSIRTSSHNGSDIHDGWNSGHHDGIGRIDGLARRLFFQYFLFAQVFLRFKLNFIPAAFLVFKLGPGVFFVLNRSRFLRMSSKIFPAHAHVFCCLDFDSLSCGAQTFSFYCRSFWTGTKQSAWFWNNGKSNGAKGAQ